MGMSVEAAYTERAAEYVGHLGTMASVHPSDVHLVGSWAASVEGPLLDAGCGPGHWTGFLAERRHDVRGVDSVPAFIEHARDRYQGVLFTVGSIDALDDQADSHGGVLAWYSLIHHDPKVIGRPLEEFARILRPGGTLLIGFFVGPAVEAFDHAVVTAWRWSVEALEQELQAAGFDVVETHTRLAASGTSRPHGALLARCRASAWSG
jgi:SAM-dependent methyltransferase